MAQDTKFVGGAEKLSRRINTIRVALAVPPMVEAIGALLLRRTLQRYDREVDPSERPWKPLANSTLARRKRAGGYPGKKKLVQTGELRGAIRVLRGLAEGGIYTNTGAGVRIGIDGDDEELVGKARAHQRGTKRIPVRQFLGVAKADITAVDGLLRRAAAKAGL